MLDSAARQEFLAGFGRFLVNCQCVDLRYHGGPGLRARSSLLYVSDNIPIATEGMIDGANLVKFDI